MFPIIFLRYVWSPSHIDTPTRICHSVYRRRNLTNSMTSICFGCERHRILLRCNGRLEILPHASESSRVHLCLLSDALALALLAAVLWLVCLDAVSSSCS